MRQTILLGDIHGTLNNILYFARTKRDLDIIQVGDFGMGFIKYDQDISNLLNINEFLEERNIHLYAIRGNHDNPMFFEGHHNYSNVHLLKDYEQMELNGKNFFFIGGGISIDRLPRIAEAKSRISWWKDEKFVFDEVKLKEAKGIDIVITHSCPKFAFPFGVDAPIVNSFAKHDPTLKAELIAEREQISEAYEILKNNNNIKLWAYGHFHNSHKMNYDSTEFLLLDICEFYELKSDI